MREQSTPLRRPMTKRRLLIVAGMAAAALGLALCGIGWWQQWRALVLFGAVSTGVGAIWLACAPFSCDEPLRPAARRYVREFFPAILAYMVLLFIAQPLLGRVHSTPLRVLVALLPVLPVAWLLRAMLRLLMGSDELEQKQQLQAIAIAAMSVALLSFAVAFLQTAGLFPVTHALFLVLPAMFAIYGLAIWWVLRRYRGDRE